MQIVAVLSFGADIQWIKDNLNWKFRWRNYMIIWKETDLDWKSWNVAVIYNLRWSLRLNLFKTTKLERENLDPILSDLLIAWYCFWERMAKFFGCFQPYRMLDIYDYENPVLNWEKFDWTGSKVKLNCFFQSLYGYLCIISSSLQSHIRKFSLKTIFGRTPFSAFHFQEGI